MFVFPLRLDSRLWNCLLARDLNLSLDYLKNYITRIHTILQFAVTIHEHLNFKSILKARYVRILTVDNNLHVFFEQRSLQDLVVISCYPIPSTPLSFM